MYKHFVGSVRRGCRATYASRLSIRHASTQELNQLSLYSHLQGSHNRWTAAIPAAFLVGYGAFLCTEEAQTSCEASSTGEEDPYENLPEEDEETSCSMCKTFRQGPCRPEWRKLERCFKDHEDEENGASKCMKYFTPHQACLMNYSNLYQLITLSAKQELVRDAELSVTKDERRSWDPRIDWSRWKEFTDEVGKDFRQTIGGSNKDTPLWKRFREEVEPVLVSPTVFVPKERDGMILKLIYVTDQNGMALGLSFNKEYGALLEEAKGNSTKEEDGSKTDSSGAGSIIDENNQRDFELEFYILPGDTTHVTVSAMYAENPTLASADKEILDALLFTGPRKSLKVVAS